VRDRDELGAPPMDQLAHRLNVHSALGGVRRALDVDAETLRERQVHDLVRDVVRARGQDHIAALELKCRERLRERHSRILDEGDVVGVCAGERGHGRIGSENGVVAFIGSLVTSHACLELEVLVDRAGDRGGHEPCTGVVQVDALGAAGGVGPQGVKVEVRGGQGKRRVPPTSLHG